MPKQPLPIIDSTRTEFGFARTACSCDECTLNCRHIPGYLIPADLDRIRQALAPAEDLFAWAISHLLASPGAKVMTEGRIIRIPTLVPARQATGSCIFLTADNHCAIHAVSPFGCAYFDCCQSRAESDQRSIQGLQAVYAAWVNGDPYGQVWLALDQAGCNAPAPEVARRGLQQAFGRMNHS